MPNITVCKAFHLKRARYNASAITVYRAQPGDEFDDVQELYVVYLTENDFIGEGRTIYHAEMTVKETGKALNDGLHEVFVNTEYNDPTFLFIFRTCQRVSDSFVKPVTISHETV